MATKPAPRRRKGPAQPWLKPGIFAGALAPVAVILWRLHAGTLGADPIAVALNQLGLVALIFLIASLAATPAKAIFGWAWPVRVRREIGLFAFFYALLHVSTYTGLDQTFHLRAIWDDVLKRKFIFVGFAAFSCLIPLAITSTNASVRRLGFARWKRLHRLAYAAASLGAIHFFWRVKKDHTLPLTYAAVLASFFLVRIAFRSRARIAARTPPAG